MSEYGIYVPYPWEGEWNVIHHGSAIVGRDSGPLLVLDFEGNVYDAANLQRWHERLLHAVDRAHNRYPTRARLVSSKPRMARIGTVRYDGKEMWFEVTDRFRLAAWLHTKNEEHLKAELGEEDRG